MFFPKYRGLMLICLVTAILSICAVSAYADSVDVEITFGVFIQNPSGDNGILLLQFDLPSNLADTQIVFSELTFSITPEIPDSTALIIACRPLLNPWNPDEIEWRDLGKIPDSSVMLLEEASFITGTMESQPAYFDVTGFTKAWINGTIVNNGLAFFCDLNRIPYFHFVQNQGSPLARLKITYTI
jgi:hypothetical protein